jgi:hypothetical protein
MSLTSGQLAALKADILADGTLNAKPNNQDGDLEIAAAYNLTAVPDFTVWRSTTTTDEIFNGVTWANLTPNDAPDGTQTWLNRALACQGKQFNVQTMLSGRATLASGKTNVRAGLQDALSNVPSGAAGATVSAGWTVVRDSMKRNATRGEKLFATGGNGAFATPADLAFEGNLSWQDVYNARTS